MSATPEGLRATLPGIPWDEPLPLTVNGVTVYTCRYCIAIHGIRGIDVLNGEAGYHSVEECAAHIQIEHTAPHGGGW